MNKKMQKDINDYFDKESPEPNMETFRKIKENIYSNQNQKKQMLKYVLPMASIVIITVISIIFTLILTNKTPPSNPTTPPNYYMDNILTKTDTNIEFLQDYISNYYTKYDFIFSEDYEIYECSKFSHEENIKMLNIKLYNNLPPFTEIEMILIIDNLLIYSDDNNFKKSAQITTTNNYKMYYTEIETLYSNKINVLFEYENYRLYLSFNIQDTELLEKFK